MMEATNGRRATLFPTIPVRRAFEYFIAQGEVVSEPPLNPTTSELNVAVGLKRMMAGAEGDVVTDREYDAVEQLVEEAVLEEVLDTVGVVECEGEDVGQLVREPVELPNEVKVPDTERDPHAEAVAERVYVAVAHLD